jgi:hypothetical protein
VLATLSTHGVQLVHSFDSGGAHRRAAGARSGSRGSAAGCCSPWQRFTRSVRRSRRARAIEPGDRMLADLTVTSSKRAPTALLPNGDAESVDTNEIYSASYDWLVAFRDFCRQSGGFEVL